MLLRHTRLTASNVESRHRRSSGTDAERTATSTAAYTAAHIDAAHPAAAPTG
jgi:hypothetical protein